MFEKTIIEITSDVVLHFNHGNCIGWICFGVRFNIDEATTSITIEVPQRGAGDHIKFFLSLHLDKGSRT